MTTKVLVHEFIRVSGELFEVQSLTYATAENPTVKVRIVRTGKIQRVHKSEIIHSH